MELQLLKGVGPKTEEIFRRLGIHSAEELLFYFPTDYLLYPPLRAVSELREGETEAVYASLVGDGRLFRGNGLVTLTVSAGDLSGRLFLRWFHSPFLKKRLRAGEGFVFYGRVSRFRGRLFMEQPKLFSREEYKKMQGVPEPVYPKSAGLSGQTIRKAVRAALLGFSEDPSPLRAFDFVPETLRRRRDLPGLYESLSAVHCPGSEEEALLARERFSYEELLLFSLALLRRKRERSGERSRFLLTEREEAERFLHSLPFSLTEGQREAIREIEGELSGGFVMNRLLQGDVGSGKTVVAFYALFLAASSGFQAAMMAPTELLARQHYEKLREILKKLSLPWEAALLTGSLSRGEKRELCRRIEEGELRLILGTHALFQEGIHYPALSLVVTDEQQRFGVLQRKAFSEKGSRPHILLLSATPIPRTLSLLLYQDMQVSRIPGRPAERLPVKNALIGAGERGKAWRFLAGECRKGRQAYIICPMIEDNGEPELQNVSEYQRKLRAFLPEDFRIEGLHGRMRAEEKERIMESFLRREIDILVSTTVVEVGVDVPNASVILIENAERFGLAQLHQLRGRVGRSALQSYCILLDCKNSKKSRERLSVLVRSNDGFWIAEEDLRLRGPGELFGIRQSGALQFRFADIYRDKELWKEASRDATELLEEDPGLSEKRNEKLQKRLFAFEEAGEVL